MKKTKKRIRMRPQLKATFTFSKKIARRFHDIRYYDVTGREIKNYAHRKLQKSIYSTRRRERITNLIEKYKTLLEYKEQGMFRQLRGIFDKNMKSAFQEGEKPRHSNLLYLVSSVPLLMTSYKAVRKNKGALTKAWILSANRYNKLSGFQRSFLNKTFKSPDRVSNNIFQITSWLLRRGLYPWGASKRIYIDKPGQPGVLRPLTIPPFMDRVVQMAITMVLTAIYEPWFLKRNRSFGFRSRYGVHDAITVLTTYKARGLNIALEGDIKSAYDKVNRETLIKILKRRIQDNKFLDLIKTRLDYQYYDSTTGKYAEEKEGIPQGGSDSPYLWNIYMMEFDEYVHEYLEKEFETHNIKVRGTEKTKKKEDRIILTPEKRKLEKLRSGMRKMVSFLNKNYNKHEQLLYFKENLSKIVVTETKQIREIFTPLIDQVQKEKLDTDTLKYAVMKKIRKTTHQMRKEPAQKPGTKFLRGIYVRYADDWIILTNAPIYIVQKIKNHLAEWLKNNLHATLAENKTLITDITKDPAHFLGFELRMSAHDRFKKSKDVKNGKIERKMNRIGKTVFALPDRKRLINKLFMKGYCNEKGSPKEVGWLSCLEAFMIIERYNAVISGLCDYYTEFVKTPQKQLSRWVYILRFSCLKTLAQKYNTSIKKIFQKFKTKNPIGLGTKERTIAIKVQQTFEDMVYEKEWRLLTLKEALRQSKAINRKKLVEDRYWAIEKRVADLETHAKEGLEDFSSAIRNKKASRGLPAITDDNYLDKIMWVN